MRFTYEYVKNFIEIESNSGYKLLSTGYRPRVNLEVQCDKGHTYFCNFDNFKNKNIRCNRCSGLPRFTYEEVKRYIEIESDSGFTLLSTSYKNNNTKLKLLCDKCHEIELPYRSFKDQGYRCKYCACAKVSKRMTGAPRETHPSFKKELTEEHRQYKRLIPNYKEWVFDVFTRDNFTCQCCNIRSSVKLNAHHLDGYNWCLEKRTEVDNGITLCEKCHVEFHRECGFGDNTKEQFYEWLDWYRQNKSVIAV